MYRIEANVINTEFGDQRQKLIATRTNWLSAYNTRDNLRSFAERGDTLLEV